MLTLEAKATDAETFGAYHFQNTGTKPVHIVEVHTSCSDCTEAAAAKSTIAPGEKGEIQVVFHVDRQMDAKDKQVFVKTDDGSPEKALTLKIHVDEVIHFEPRKLAWKAGEAREPKTVDAQILTDGKPSDILVTSSSGAIKVECVPAKQKGSYQLKISPIVGDAPASAWIRMEAKYKTGKPVVATFFVSAQ
ncbi:MAG: DUF1573 domain-containing protein [Chthoniobacteraceae bacterium]